LEVDDFVKERIALLAASLSIDPRFSTLRLILALPKGGGDFLAAGQHDEPPVTFNVGVLAPPRSGL
jgi:hypothetical protein